MRAQVILGEVDQSARVPSVPGVVGAISGAFLKGYIDKHILVTDEASMLRDTTPDGTIKVGYPLAYYSAQAFLAKSNRLYMCRAANEPRYGGVFLAQAVPYSEATILVNSGRNIVTLATGTNTQKATAAALYPTVSRGEAVQFRSVGGSLPSPLQEGKTYYVDKYNEDAYEFNIADSQEDAINGSFLVLDNDGSGELLMSFVGINSNGELEYPLKNPSTYVMDSSDGKAAGQSSTITVAVNNDEFKVSKEFFATANHGDKITMAATTFPDAELGSEFSESETYYLIKKSNGKVQLARTKADATSGAFIPVGTAGEGITFSLKEKVTNSAATPNPASNDFLVSETFWNTVKEGSVVKFATDGAYPTVTDGGQPFSSSVDYYIKPMDSAGKVQLFRTENGQAIQFGDAGAGVMSLTMKDAEVQTDVETDLSEDILTISSSMWTNIETQYAVKFDANGGTLPDGIDEDTTYYVIKMATEGKIKVAQSAIAAEVGEAIDITNAGSDEVLIKDVHNSVLTGYTKKLMLVHGANPGEWNNDLYLRTVSYPNKPEHEWTDDDEAAALAVKIPGCFRIYVYKQDSEGGYVELESILASRNPDMLDGNGVNLYVEEASKSSKNIRIVDNKSVHHSVLPKNQSQFLKLCKGSNGETVTDSHMLQSLDMLESRNEVSFQILMDGGWATPAYQKQGIIALCEKRKDCMGLLSTPISAELSADPLRSVVNYRNKELNANTSYAALHCSYLKIQDKFNSRQILVPPDGFVGAAVSQTATTYEIWYPVAGNKRGILKVLDVANRWKSGQMDELYANGINPIEFRAGKGIRIWGQKTLLSRDSALDRMNVRLLLITIEPAIADWLEDEFIFEFNDKLTRSLCVSGINSYMTNILARRGVYGFTVVCDESNNTPEDIDANRMNVELHVQPTKAAEFIPFSTIITRTGMSALTVG